MKPRIVDVQILISREAGEMMSEQSEFIMNQVTSKPSSASGLLMDPVDEKGDGKSLPSENGPAKISA